MPGLQGVSTPPIEIPELGIEITAQPLVLSYSGSSNIGSDNPAINMDSNLWSGPGTKDYETRVVSDGNLYLSGSITVSPITKPDTKAPVAALNIVSTGGVSSAVRLRRAFPASFLLYLAHTPAMDVRSLSACMQLLISWSTGFSNGFEAMFSVTTMPVITVGSYLTISLSAFSATTTIYIGNTGEKATARGLLRAGSCAMLPCCSHLRYHPLSDVQTTRTYATSPRRPTPMPPCSRWLRWWVLQQCNCYACAGWWSISYIDATPHPTPCPALPCPVLPASAVHLYPRDAWCCHQRHQPHLQRKQQCHCHMPQPRTATLCGRAGLLPHRKHICERRALPSSAANLLHHIPLSRSPVRWSAPTYHRASEQRCAAAPAPSAF